MVRNKKGGSLLGAPVRDEVRKSKHRVQKLLTMGFFMLIFDIRAGWARRFLGFQKRRCFMYRRSFTLLTKGLVVVAMALWVGRAMASESRADALLYNPGFYDLVDIFTFPQLANHYNLVTFYVPGENTTKHMYGGLVYKNFGFFIHRPVSGIESHYRLVAVPGIPQEFEFPANPQGTLFGNPPVVFDLLWGNGQFGAGLKFFANAQNHTTQSNEDVADDVEGARMVGASVSLGYSPMEGADLGLLGRFGNVKDRYTFADVGVKARYIADPKAETSLVALLALDFLLWAPKEGDNKWTFGVPLKGGLRLIPVADRLTVSALAGLDLQLLDPGEGDKQFALVVPTGEIAAELKVLKWLFLRSSVKGGFGILLAGKKVNDTKYHDTTTQVCFNSGLGLEYNNFVFDATIKYQLWQNGPYILGGEKGLFGSASLTYNF